jgi:tRNA dimethylallyltransferase
VVVEHPQRWPLVCIMGPTAVGKTELAMRVADTLAVEGIGVDLISVDAVQVYRGLNIGSAKPDADTLKRYPHALIDIRSPLETYDAWQFCRDALACMEQSRRQQRIPVLVGGSMFYFAALLHGLDQLPGADPKFRAELEVEADRMGWPALHQRLQKLDPVAAANISTNDSQRITRALEIAAGDDPQRHSAAVRTNPRQATPSLRAGGWVALKFAVHDLDRLALHQRIAERAHVMLEQGLVSEVRLLMQRHDMLEQPASLRSTGYRQAWEILHGRLAESALADIMASATRQLAKRQFTWLRNEGGVIWVNRQWEKCHEWVAMRITNESKYHK